MSKKNILTFSGISVLQINSARQGLKKTLPGSVIHGLNQPICTIKGHAIRAMDIILLENQITLILKI